VDRSCRIHVFLACDKFPSLRVQLGVDAGLWDGVLSRAVKTKSSFWLPLLLMLVFALSRWPGFLPENFSAAYALAFCAGVYFTGSMAWWFPLGVLFITNTLLNLFYYEFPVWDWFTLVSLAGFATLVWLGRRFRPGSAWWKLVSGGLLGAVLFYLMTNTLSWVFEPTQPYPKTLAGWIQALTRGTAGWPETWTFFRNTLLSGGLFTGLFAGAMKLAEKMEPEEQPEPAEEPEPEKPVEEARPQES
jgi:hypothetical protein